ncbi:LamB/YcsF family protein [Microbulbifer flavimaris]|uniref:LamB/YcsF family protein n=1 Tax=Microbulbifer flavimaris TaxID=1781068 RepID=A0ABX4I528_9GAMM|nr:MULTISPECIES: 5-oxoprolinase subunit PxpA [Microbulbifer]PCO06619.1 LamB/YcsF family protein [Microbulbifer flavimaris]
MIKLNCDLGEGYGNWQLVDEAEVMPHIDMANVACGFHAGDPLTVHRTVQLAKAHGVAIGAHPSYPDLVGFGRRSMACPPEEVTAMVLYQAGALQGLCAAEETRLTYIKPHGALYHDMMGKEEVYRAILEAVRRMEQDIPLMLMATPERGRFEEVAAEYAVPLLFEAFADRRYRPDGSLTPRTEAGAVLQNAEAVVAQVKDIAAGHIVASDGKRYPLEADTICVHGDNPHGVAVIREIRKALNS